MRLRQNFIGGKVDDNPLTIGATTLTSSALAALQVVGSPDVMAITIDPDGIFGAPEVVWVTTHTASATTATITRGQETSTARAHNQDEDWVHGPTVTDYSVATGTTTLVAGTVAVSNTSITATSVIRLSVYTPGGTVGAPYISVKTAGTGFTVTSTSGTDTSIIYYEIVSY